MQWRVVLQYGLFTLVWCVAGVGSAQQTTESPANDTESAAPERTADEKSRTPDASETADDNAVQPRYQAHLPSISKLATAAQKSRAGRIALHVARVIAESRDEPAEGLKNDVFLRALQLVAKWPDTSVDVALFSPDVEGRMRWTVRLGLPIGQAHDLVADLTGDEQLAEFFEGLEESIEGQTFVYTVGQRPAATLKADGTDRCILCSHADLKLPTDMFTGTEGEGVLVLASSLALTKTETDSGATFFSKFDVVKSIDYTARIGESGDWQEQLRVNWPPVAGMTMKTILGKAKQTFFLPDRAFFGAVFNVALVKPMLDRSVGLADALDNPLGPIQEHAGDELFVAVMPGVGFLPAPDIVMQTRVSDAEDLVDEIAQRIKKLNKKAKRKDQRPAWREASVRGKRVFWSRGATQISGLVPVTFRPVLFVEESADAKDRKRTYLVMGWTSTDPERFVRRWLGVERSEQARFLPSQRGLNGEAWVHWQQLYDWVHPYVNLALTSVASDGVLPEEMGEDIGAADIAVRLKYQGLHVAQTGPMPMGVIALPAMIASSLTETSGSDLARERIARRKLMVLYHHSQLFHQDMGRWPTSVAELDGYIDFAGNRDLLELESSSKKRLEEVFSSWFGDDDADEDEDDDEDDEDDIEGVDLEDSVFVIEWVDEAWSLGLEPETLEHLEQLYVDTEGHLHRVEASDSPEEDRDPNGETADGSAADEVDAADESDTDDSDTDDSDTDDSDTDDSDQQVSELAVEDDSDE